MARAVSGSSARRRRMAGSAVSSPTKRCQSRSIPTTAEPIDPEVRDHDPRVALYGGSEDGLAIPRLVAARAAGLLRTGGVLVMEHADSQGESLPAALRATGSWSQVEDCLDLTHRPRATVAVRA